MVRVLLRSLSALIVAGAAVLVGWRVLAPAEVLATVASPVPAPSRAEPGVTGRTGVAPLIVDGRIRVYASRRQIRADAPLDAKTVYTAIWSLRRWPAQLSGVVAGGRLVISHWSDGALIAIDGLTGKIAWRVAAGESAGYSGYRTGASAVWAPRDLRLSGDSVLVTAGGRLSAYEVSTGTRRWVVSADCASSFTTAGGQIVCRSAAYDVGTGAPVVGFPAGRYRPVGCGVASSACAGLRDGDGRGWLTTGPAPIRATTLDHQDSTVAAGVVFYPDGIGLRAIDAATGEVVREYPAGAQVLGVTSGSRVPGEQKAGSGVPDEQKAGSAVPSEQAADGRVVLLTADRRLLVVEPRGGAIFAEFPLAYDSEKRNWDPGLWQVADGYVAVERLAECGPNNPDTPGYYFSAVPVIIAAL